MRLFVRLTRNRCVRSLMRVHCTQFGEYVVLSAFAVVWFTVQYTPTRALSEVGKTEIVIILSNVIIAVENVYPYIVFYSF